MTALRVLHVDDEPDIRELVEISLKIDKALETRSCSSGQEALGVAASWNPDVILLDVMMPVMDGPATLVRLKEDAVTAGIPVIFMTARARAQDLARFTALGAVNVIAKPFDPMTLAAKVRGCMATVDPFDALRTAFLLRLGKNLRELSVLQLLLEAGPLGDVAVGELKFLAHGLAGAAGIFGFAELSEAAATLEDAIMASKDRAASDGAVASALESLIIHLNRAGATATQQ